MASETESVHTPRIAIVGAGPSGLALAGILSKQLGDKIHIDMFERGSPDQDQGYGLDLDKDGQKALALAGVYHRYWEISRPHSDVMKFYPSRGSHPLFIVFRAKLLQNLFPSMFAAQPESNRDGIRRILLEQMEQQDNMRIFYGSCPSSITQVKRDCGSRAEIADSDGRTLGVYDLVVDASGVHSRLRLNRVADAQGKHYTGRLLIHGVINDPEANASQELLSRLGQGSLIAAGGGGFLALQRFGARPDDHRTAFIYNTEREDEHSLDEELGLRNAISRQQGIRTDAESLAKVKAWLHRDMDEKYDKLYLEAVDLLDRVTVRGEHNHGDTTLREPTPLPFVVIGDALRNIGAGGGGNLALQDSIELAECLCKKEVFDLNSGRVNTQALYDAEKAMLERKNKFHEERQEEMNKLFGKSTGDQLGTPTITDLVGGNRCLAGLVKCLSGFFTLVYKWEQWRGIAGSGPASRIFPSVRACL